MSRKQTQTQRAKKPHERPRIVLDTCVFVNNLHVIFNTWQKSRPQIVASHMTVRHAFNTCTVCFTPESAQELEYLVTGRTTHLKKFASAEARQNHFAWILGRSQIVESGPLIRNCIDDADDNAIITAATGAWARYLVSCDHHLLDMGERIGRVHVLSPMRYVSEVMGMRLPQEGAPRPRADVRPASRSHHARAAARPRTAPR